MFAERRLREAILWCELVPGSLVTEAGLVDRFKLARAATRAALARLAGQGMVEPITRKGWRVRPITGGLIGSLTQARRLAEPMLGDATPTDAELRRADDLVPVIQAMRLRVEPQPIMAARQYERELLERLAGQANAFLQGWLRELWDHAERTVHFFEGRGAQRLAVSDPAPLVAAFHAGDRDAVRAQRLAAVDAFEFFAARALLADPAEIGSSGHEPARRVRRRDKEPRRADGSAHTVTKGKGAYS